MRRACLKSGLERFALYFLVAGAEQGVRSILNPRRRIALGRATVGRVVFEAAVSRGIVRRRNDQAVSETVLAPTVMDENRTRHDWCWCEAIVGLDNRLHSIRGENFQSSALSRRGRRVSVLAE